MKTRQAIITTAAIIALAAIGASVLVLREPGTAAVPTDETSAVKKVTPKNPVKKTSVSARAKPVAASPAKAAKPPRPEEDVGTAVRENAVEPPKADGVDAEKKAKDDNPFPRYLDMFRNDPAAFAAEFEKEAEVDRANQRKMREQAVAKLKLNVEQAAFFEKVLDDIRNAVFQLEQENVDLVTSGQLNMDTAADGRLWNSNTLLMDQFVAAREKIVQDAAVELYNKLDVDGISDAEKQKIIKMAAYKTAFSFDCYEPNLQVYDKVYKNMGFGNGIFSWCTRQQQSQKK